MIKQFFLRLIHERTFLKYTITGAVVSALELVLLYWLVDGLNWWYLYASSLAFFSGLLISFLLRKLLVFKNYNWSAVPQQLLEYSLVGVLNVFLNGLLMFILVDWLFIPYLWSQVIANVFLGIIGFLLNKIIIFKPVGRVVIGLPQRLKKPEAND